MFREISVICDPVMLHVWSCLHNYEYDDALFTAERLYAETKSSECLHLLATCLYRVGRPKQVSYLLKGAEPLSAKNKYLLAKCYSDIGLLGDAEETLLGTSFQQKCFDDICDTYEEQAAFVMLLLGDIRRRQGRTNDAVKCYLKCLDINPLIWSAFKNLCSLGEKPNPTKCFQMPDSFPLPTATYTVVHGGAEAPSTQDSAHPVTNRDCNKEEMETSRENVNPEKSPPTNTDVFLAPDSVTDSKSPLENTQLTRRTYISLCSKEHTEVTTFRISPVTEVLQTPQDVFSTSIAPNAPKPDLRRAGITSPAVAPRFGSLALLSQSPMFACVPVFYKTPSHGFLAAESVLSNSMRHDTNQLAPLRQSAFNQTASTNLAAAGNAGSSFLDAPHSPGNRCRTRNPDTDVGSFGVASAADFMHNPPGSNVRSGLERSAATTTATTTSTPAQMVGSLRRLIFCPSSETSSTARSGASVSFTPTGQRTDPPKLRSAAQRSSNSPVNLVEMPSRLNLSPVAGNPGATVSPSAAPRAQSSSAQGTTEMSFLDALVSTSGPRTRSQVAAVARASGALLRSNRSTRIRGTTRQKESRPQGSGSCEADTAPKLDVHALNREGPVTSPTDCMFTTAKPVEESIQVTMPSKDDPRLISMQRYLELLAHLGKAYQCLVRHQWRSAARSLAKLPDSQLHSGRILSWAARAHMDNTDYTVSKRIFMQARTLEPWQLVGMDFYSTVLWQLQADHELTHLARTLLELDRNAPEPWCAAGNCFSLQGEHEVAVRFFQRALQVSPTSAYACTLLGHEHSTLEDFESAIAAFRLALRLDPRQYNALFGLSNVYYKQEKFDQAEVHLAHAVALFPHSHLLLANLAALRVRLGRLNDGPGSALDLVSLACRIQPNNPLARYHRASILFHLGWYDDVLSELQKLMTLVPREAMVYLMIGHTYKKLGNTPQAMIHYSWAMGLDPKGANTHLRDIMANPPFLNRSSTGRRGDTSRSIYEASSSASNLPGGSTSRQGGTRRTHQPAAVEVTPSDHPVGDVGESLQDADDETYDLGNVSPVGRPGERRPTAAFSFADSVITEFESDATPEAGSGLSSSDNDQLLPQPSGHRHYQDETMELEPDEAPSGT